MHRALAIPEILGHILGFIDDDADRMSCMFVCLFWLGVAHNLRWRVNMLTLPQRYMQSEQMSRVLAHAPKDIMWATTTVTAGNALFFTKGSGMSVLSLVCKSGLSLDVAKWLAVYFGLSPADARREDCRLFHHACRGGSLEIAEWLLDYAEPTSEAIARSADAHLNKTLRIACESGHLATVRRLSEIYRISYDITRAHLFLTACRGGNLEMVWWLAHKLKHALGRLHICDAFKAACRSGRLPIAQWLADEFKVTITNARECRALSEACRGGHMDVVRWLANRYAELSMDSDDWWYVCGGQSLDDVVWLVTRFQLTADTAKESDGAMFAACGGPDIRVLAWLVEHFRITADDARSGDYMYRARFSLANLKWITERFGITVADVRKGNNRLFRTDNTVETLSWLADRFDLTADDARASDNQALINACAVGDLPRVVWLCERFGLTADDARSRDNTALRLAISNGSLECAKWLAEHFELTVDDARACDNAALRSVCKNGNLERAQWLVEHFELTADDARASNSDALIRACICGNLDIVKWLCERFAFVADDFTHVLFVDLMGRKQYAEVRQTILWILSQFRFTAKHAYADDLLCYACRTKDWELAEWLIEHVDFTPDDATFTLNHASTRCNRETTEWVTRHFEFTEAHQFKALAKACAESVDHAQWLAEHFGLNANDILRAWAQNS